MRARLTGLFLVTAGLAVAGPDGACAISQANILSPLTKITSGVPFTIPITTTGCTAPLRSVRIATGTLPIGAELYSSPTGAEISGKVYSPGIYVLTLRAIDAAYKLPTESVILQVNEALRIDTPAIASGLPGSAYSDTIRARGGVAPYTFSIVEGALPSGLGLNASSGAITGNMPAAGSRFRIRVTDSSTPANTSEQPYTITTTGLVTTITTPPVGSIGTPYSFDIDGSLGAAGFSIAIGSLPAGLTINTNGLISGTPSATGEFHITVRQTAGLTSAWRSYRLLVNDAATIAGAPRDAEEGAPYNHVFTTSGSVGPYTYAVTAGALPTGISLSSSTGALTGALPISGSGSAFTITATDASGRTHNQAFSIAAVTRLSGSTATPPTIRMTQTGTATPYILGGGGTGKEFNLIGGIGSQQVFINPFSGNTSYSFSTPGTYTPIVLGTDALGGAVLFNTVQYRAVGLLAIDPAVELPNGKVGVSYSATVPVLNGDFGPLTYTVTAGTLPMNFTIGAATGLISGTGDPMDAGQTYSFTVTVTDSAGQSAARAYFIGIASGAGVITTTSIPRATLTQSYSTTVSQTGSVNPVFTNPGGGMPPGLTLSSAGLISGIPNTAGTYTFLVRMQDAVTSATDTRQFTVNAASTPTFTMSTPSPNEATVDTSMFIGVTPSGGSSPYTLSLLSGSLPEGLFFQNFGSSIGISGFPLITANQTFTILLTDADGRTASAAYTINLRQGVRITTLSGSLPSMTTGVPYSTTLAATLGSAPYTFSIASGTLPAGLSLSSAGVLSGTPSATAASSFSILATDSFGRSGESSFNITPGTPISIGNSVPMPNGVVLSSYSVGLNTGLEANSTRIVSGDLPPLLYISSSSGMIVGAPTLPGVYTFTVQVDDGDGRLATQAQQITVLGGLSFTPATVPNGVLSSPYSVTFVPVNASGSVTWSIVAGSLPTGLTLNPTSGILSGTPNATGPFSFTVQAVDAALVPVTQNYTMQVANFLTINPATVPNGTVGASYSQVLTASGGSGGTSWGITAGALPGGLTLGPSNGILSGTPTTAGTFNFTVTATDSFSQTGSRAYTVTIASVLSITPSSLPNGSVSTSYSQQLTATGGTGAIGWAITAGALPGGLTLGPTSGAITGTPTTAGSFNFTVTATDSLSQTGVRAYSMTVLNTLSITPASLPNGTISTVYNQQLTATGGTGAIGWAVTAGALPAGLTLGPTSGAIRGTPTAAGTFNFTVTATDSLTQTGSRAYSMTVLNVLSITPSSLPNGAVSTAYSQQLTATGGTGAIGWAVSAGALPGGLTLNPTTGAISGTPTAAGAFSFTVTATDSLTQSGSQAYSITIANVLTIGPATLPNGTISTAYTQQLTATGGTGAIGWAVTAGALPGGLTLGPTSGAITGAPTAAGAFTFTVTATDSLSQTGSRVYALTVNGVLTITPSSLPSGTINTAYSQQLTASGGTGAIGWTVSAGALPGGLTLNPTTGAITGTPTAAGSFNFTVTATDSLTQTGAQGYSLTIANALTIGPASLPNGTISTPYTQQLTATGGSGVPIWSVTAGALPGGLTLGPTTGAITGTPTASGVFSFTVTATDSLSQTGSRSYSLTINGVLTITPATLPNGTINSAYSQQLTATGATSWAITAGALPGGLTLNPTTGVLSGTPTAAGSSAFTVTATDAQSQTGVRAYSLVILNTLTIAPTTLPNGTAGSVYSQQLTATPTTTGISWAVSAGTLPTGLTLNPQTGQLTGTPTAPGQYTFTATATDLLSQTGSRAYTVTILAVLSLSPASVPVVYTGIPYSQAFTAAGGTGAITWSIGSAPLPPGLTLNPATGIVSGTTSATTGVFTVTLQATDTLSQTGSRSYDFLVRPPVTITPATLPDATQGIAYSQTLTANGALGIALFQLTAGALPAGLTLANNGVISGTPTTVGTATFDVTVATPQQQVATRTLTLTVLDPLAISTAALPDGTEFEAYSTTLAATGGAASGLTWSIQTGSTLPPGLALSNAGVLAGTPTVHGTYTFTVQVANATGTRVAKPFTLVVVEALSITSLSLGETVQGRSYTTTLTALGGRAPYTWALVNSSLPAGLQLNPTTGLITGTTNVAEGTFPQNVVVTDSRGRVARRTLPFAVTAPPPPSLNISPSSIANGRVNQPYSAGFSASGGTPGYSFAIVQGAPPTGLTLNGTTLSGTPTQEGTFRFTVNATDSQGRVAGNQYTVVIEAALVPLVVTPSSIAPTTPVGQPLTLQFGATGGKAPYTFAITGNTPPGTSSNSSGVLSGTPSQGGTFSFNVQVTDSLGDKASRGYSLSVTGNLVITTQPPLAEGTVGKPYSLTFGAAGGKQPYTWSIAGTPPPGLAFNNGNLTGTPTAAGTFSFSVTVQDTQQLSASASFSITIWDPVTITSTLADTPLVTGQPFNFTVTTIGGKPTVTLTLIGGALPPGLTFVNGVISGTPTGTGNFSFTIQAIDGLGNATTQTSTLRVVAPLTVTTTTLPSGTVGTAYTAAVAATGGVAPLGTWSLSQGSLPAGLTLSPDGVISGTPTAPGTSTFTVRITDAANTATTRQLTISIQLPPVPGLILPGLPQFLTPGTQTNITIQLAQPFPVPVTGTLTLIFEPNAVNNADDPSVQFSSGGRTVTFVIPAGQTAGTFPVTPLRLISGTVAGTIRIRITTSPESATPVPDAIVPITRSAPVITAGTAQLSATSFTLLIDGFSNTREIVSATFRLTPAPGSSLATTDVPVNVAATFAAYYQSAASIPFGGQFRLTQPFNVNGPLTDIDSVVVTVTNSVGTSQPFTIRLR